MLLLVRTKRTERDLLDRFLCTTKPPDFVLARTRELSKHTIDV